ncbi:hypothetical protein SSAG_03774 [Streptomyces sp. Mg1]|nr:hypothetical protein SSAG_03774 [Streptomyces sp. Mg1]
MVLSKASSRKALRRCDGYGCCRFCARTGRHVTTRMYKHVEYSPRKPVGGRFHVKHPLCFT